MGKNITENIANSLKSKKTTYIYNKKGEFVKKKLEQTEPCSVVIIDEKKRSVIRGINLEGQ
jgi:hypothetical protein